MRPCALGLAFILLPLIWARAPVEAGRNTETGGGAWLIDDRGQMVAPLPNEEGAAFDPQGEVIYQLKEGHLVAIAMRTAHPLWRVACPDATPPHAILLRAPDSRVLVVSKERIRCFDTKQGVQRYDVATDGFGLRGPIAFPWRPFVQSVGDTLYLANEKEKHLRGAQGVWLGSEAVVPPTIRGIDTRTGRTTVAFEARFPDPRALIGDLARGVYISRGRPEMAGGLRSREQTAAFFSPTKGTPSGAPTFVRDAVLGSAGTYLLLDTTPPMLRAWDAIRSASRWTTPGLPGALRIVSISTERVVVDASSHAVVFDAATGAEQARLALPVEPLRHRPIDVHDTGTRLLLRLTQEDGSVATTAVDTTSWRPIWQAPGETIEVADAERVLSITGLDRVRRAANVTPRAWKEQGPAVIVRDTSNGRRILRWSVPGPGRAVEHIHCHARRTPSGYVVRTNWSAP